jgi:hypothetical protein
MISTNVYISSITTQDEVQAPPKCCNLSTCDADAGGLGVWWQFHYNNKVAGVGQPRSKWDPILKTK